MPKRQNIAGLRYGRLTVLDSYVRKKGYDGRTRTFWSVRCDCGKTGEAQVNVLNSGHKKSCGCLLEGLPAEQAEINARFRSAKLSAKHRGIPWQLTREQFEELIRGHCHWCGEPAQFKAYRKKKGRWGAIQNGIDRKDSSLGYIAENCVSCCWPCNRLKGDLPISVFIDRCQRIARRHSTNHANSRKDGMHDS